MTGHETGTREAWRAARLGLLDAEKELTRRGDELAWRRQAFAAEQRRSGTVEYTFRAMDTRTELTDQQTLVDGVDANARTAVGRRCDVAPRHGGRDDGCDDAAVPGADAVALPPGRW